jgi:hypothetical protein
MATLSFSRLSGIPRGLVVVGLILPRLARLRLSTAFYKRRALMRSSVFSDLLVSFIF